MDGRRTGKLRDLVFLEAMVVREIRQTPSDKGYISLRIEANLTSEGNLAAYVESRTNALNALLDSIATNSTIEAVITFKDPISPEDFASLCETPLKSLESTQLS